MYDILLRCGQDCVSDVEATREGSSGAMIHVESITFQSRSQAQVSPSRPIGPDLHSDGTRHVISEGDFVSHLHLHAKSHPLSS